MQNSSKTIKKKQQISVAEKIMKVIDKQPKIAEEIRRELKDRFGHSEQSEAIRINLLYLLRRERITRKKENGKYKYFI